MSFSRADGPRHYLRVAGKTWIILKNLMALSIRVTEDSSRIEMDIKWCIGKKRHNMNGRHAECHLSRIPRYPFSFGTHSRMNISTFDINRNWIFGRQNLLNFLSKYRISAKFSLMAAMYASSKREFRQKQRTFFVVLVIFFSSRFFFFFFATVSRKQHANDNPPRGQRILNFTKIWPFLLEEMDRMRTFGNNTFVWQILSWFFPRQRDRVIDLITELFNFKSYKFVK